ncbi:hypothetical protein I3842_10G098600 [Carya illinoinensis]|uniref:Protein kinase domain-containing protein n=1 Tax=Carya illinoinensis TaxID=32201 RepID=A0A922DXY1_CARIL|nr:hypothetical protein I3842_10G098600 [Carya illinoinensis]
MPQAELPDDYLLNTPLTQFETNPSEPSFPTTSLDSTPLPTQSIELQTIPPFEEYGCEGIVSTRGDVYSYGILLMDAFTRKKPIDDMFTGEMSLKRLVEESFLLSILEVIDPNLLGNENDYAAMETCLSTTMGLALHCCADLPKQRIDIKNVLARLKKIKVKYLHDHGGR